MAQYSWQWHSILIPRVGEVNEEHQLKQDECEPTGQSKVHPHRVHTEKKSDLKMKKTVKIKVDMKKQLR